MNTRLPLIIGVLLIFVIAAILVLIYVRPGMPTLPVQTPMATSTKTTTVEDSGQYYDITATYPSEVALQASASPSARATAKAVVDAWIKETIATFKANSGLETLTDEDIRIQGLGEGRKYALDIHYTTHEDAHTISYLFEVYEDSLGAHPNAYYRSFSFDAATGKELRIADIFTGSGYLATLSRISREMLVPQIAKATNVDEDELDTSDIETGTAPDPNNFQVFYFEGTNLVIVFTPYQVGPWVLGTQVIKIPRAQLSSELKAEYR